MIKLLNKCRVSICLLLISVMLITSFPYAYGATLLPLTVQSQDMNNNTQTNQDRIIEDSSMRMVVTKTTVAYKQPSSESKGAYIIMGGAIVCADVNSFNNEFVTIEYNDSICYIDGNLLKAVIGNTQAVMDKIEKIKGDYEYTAKNVVDVIPATTHYSVNGKTLDYDYQDFIWTLCVKWGIEDYFPILLCQFYHESNFRQDVISRTNDYGICQLNGKYHTAWIKKVGHPEWDVKIDPYANMYVGVYLMAKKIKATNGNIDIAMTLYNAGGGYYKKYGIREVYVNNVHKWESTLKALD